MSSNTKYIYLADATHMDEDGIQRLDAVGYFLTPYGAAKALNFLAEKNLFPMYFDGDMTQEFKGTVYKITKTQIGMFYIRKPE